MSEGELRRGDVVADRYRVVRRIGTGGMGDVYEAEQLTLGRPVALKVLRDRDAKALARFEHEARALARLRHPNVVRVYDFSPGTGTDGAAFLAMELLRGESLSRRMRREGRLEIAHVVVITSSVLRGLQAIHEGEIIHRDLKPSNVFLSPGEGAKIVDFGIAKVKGERSLTGVGDGILGTPSYLAPEQLRGEPPDPRTDLHALGVCMFEMLTGEKLWKPRSTAEVVEQILHAEARSVSELRGDVPAGLANVVKRALSKDREARFASAAEMLEALVPAPAEPRSDTQPHVRLPRPEPPAAATVAMLTRPETESQPGMFGGPTRWAFVGLCALGLCALAYRNCSRSDSAPTPSTSEEAPLH